MSYRAFTLLETLIVLVIMVLFMAFSVPFFTEFTERSKLETASRSVTSALRTARGFAITNNRDFYVVFDTATEPDEFFIVDSLTSPNPMEKRERLPAGVTFYNPGGASGSEIGFTNTVNISGADKKAAFFESTGRLDESLNRDVYLAEGTTVSSPYKQITVIKTTGTVKIN